jgi:hypothetical protein
LDSALKTNLVNETLLDAFEAGDSESPMIRSLINIRSSTQKLARIEAWIELFIYNG